MTGPVPTTPETNPMATPLPFEKIDPDDLERRLARTRGRSMSAILFRKAQLHWELAFHPDVDEPTRSRHAQGAEEVLGELTAQGTKPAPGSSLLMYTQLPNLLYPTGKMAGDMQQISKSRSLAAIRMYEQRYASLGDSRAIGMCTEMFALQGLVTYGVQSAPSLGRQETTLRLVDGKSYTWDVTLRPDGADLSKGVYRTQVKHSAKGRRGIGSQKYHPDIVRFNLLSKAETFDPASPYVFAVARVALGIPPTDQDELRTYARSVNRLYATLDTHGPSVLGDADVTLPFVHA